MRIAVIGNGGREHAILWRLARDPEKHDLLAVPGNGGTHRLAKSIPSDTNNALRLTETIAKLRPDLVVVGPELPLANGITDALDDLNIPCFGPSRAAAQIEASKVFAKRLMHEAEIPTAEFGVFTEYSAVEQFLHNRSNENWVVKADGLAAGKGAFVCDSQGEILIVASKLLVEGSLGDAGKTIILEKRLYGREVSALYLCDGERFLSLPAAQDYKRALDGDAGPNTGGMGSYCPAAHLTPTLRSAVDNLIISKTLKALVQNGSPYRGVLYAGLMLTDAGPQVIEFNCRFGDPETQVILPLIKGNFARLLLECALGHLQSECEISSDFVVCVVLAAEGYPGNYVKSIPLKEISDSNTSFIFHAGTSRVNDTLISNGGRVFNAIGVAPTIELARDRACEVAKRVVVAGLRYRRDIASNTP
jgi:phosphoribosylamine---glycine ligase